MAGNGRERPCMRCVPFSHALSTGMPGLHFCCRSQQWVMPYDRGGVMRAQISVVVYAFKYPARTALAVGLSMAQIGEFAFVLLSVASQLGLLPYQVYMLLMGARPMSMRLHPCPLYGIERFNASESAERHTIHFTLGKA